MARIINGIEIPEDFDGIDDDIALGMMKDNGLISDQQEEAEDTTKVDPTEEKPVETTESEKVVAPATTEDAALVKEQKTGEETDDLTDDANGKTVPYQAMIFERNKRKALAAELAQLKAQYANPAQTQLPAVSTQPPVTEKEAEQTTNQKKAYFDYIKKTARELFVDEFHREPDSLDDDDPLILGSYAADVRDSIREAQKQQKKNADEAETINQSYHKFANDQRARDEFDEIEASFVSAIKALPPEEQELIQKSLWKCENNKGTQLDIYTVKNFWNDVAKKHIQPAATEAKQPEKVVIPPKPAKTAEQKLAEIEKHPKTNLVSGTNTSKSGRSMDEIARLMNEMSWPDFVKTYPADAEYVLNG